MGRWTVDPCKSNAEVWTVEHGREWRVWEKIVREWEENGDMAGLSGLLNQEIMRADGREEWFT